jgi:hypothetical protein
LVGIELAGIELAGIKLVGIELVGIELVGIVLIHSGFPDSSTAGAGTATPFVGTCINCAKIVVVAGSMVMVGGQSSKTVVVIVRISTTMSAGMRSDQSLSLGSNCCA